MKKFNHVILANILCLLFISCKSEEDIIVYYKMGLVNSPVSFTSSQFIEEADTHDVDTVIRLDEDAFSSLTEKIENVSFDEEKCTESHDFFINLRYKGISLCIPLASPFSSNKTVETFSKNQKAYLDKEALYIILCKARYFDFFQKDELPLTLTKPFGIPSDYKYYFENKSGLPFPLRSRYKVILRSK